MENKRFNNFLKGYQKLQIKKKEKITKKINLENINKIILNKNSILLDYKFYFFF